MKQGAIGGGAKNEIPRLAASALVITHVTHSPRRGHSQLCPLTEYERQMPPPCREITRQIDLDNDIGGAPMKTPSAARIWIVGAATTVFAVACSAGMGDTSSSSTGSSESTGSSMVGGMGGMGGQGGGSSQGGDGGIIFAGGGGGAPPLVDVDVVITADNAYSFGYGDVNGITNFTQGTRAQTAGQIFNCGEGPEAYKVPAADAPPTAYLYIVTWDDLAVTQGVLGQFRRGMGVPLYTGDPLFQVCGTGINMQASQMGPTQTELFGGQASEAGEVDLILCP